MKVARKISGLRQRPLSKGAVQSVTSNFAHRASLSLYSKPNFQNEPSPTYAPGTPERAGIKSALRDLKAKLPVEIPLRIGEQEIITSQLLTQINPSKHSEVVANYTPASASNIKDAIAAALVAKPAWENLPFEHRAAIFLRAADLVAGKYRHELMAAAMVGQGKNIWQAEIDIAAETCDLFRFNVQCAMELFAQQPAVNPAGMWNRLEYRALEGFVYAISPFNFTALGATLAGGPLLMGNVVIWKPSLSALHSSWVLYNILLEAGLPKDVLQFVPGDPVEITDAVLESPDFAGVNFTGSTSVFKSLIAKIGVKTGEDKFLNYPRIVGETGGKNFHLVHKSAEIENAVNSTIRSAFEFQGQKCSAASRLYVPETIWPEFKENLLEKMKSVKVGDPTELENFVNPVIHEQAFDRLAAAIEEAKSDPELEILAGGRASKDVGFYVQPTIYQTSNPHHPMMKTELFGPILTIYIYPDESWPSVPKLIESTTRYALTGSVFAQDAAAIAFADKELRHAAGNWYVNCKSTGSVVGQQPFGGMRGSGTNDKVGSVGGLARWVSVRAVKEDFQGLKGRDGWRNASNEV